MAFNVFRATIFNEKQRVAYRLVVNVVIMDLDDFVDRLFSLERHERKSYKQTFNIQTSPDIDRRSANFDT